MTTRATGAALAMALALGAVPAGAEDRVVTAIASLSEGDKEQVLVSKCAVTVSFANEGPRPVALSVELLWLLKDNSFSAMVAPAPRAFGRKTKVRATVEPGATGEDGVDLLGVDCDDLAGMVMLPECRTGTDPAAGEDCATALVAGPETLVPIGMPHDPDPEPEDAPQDHEGDAEAGIVTLPPGPAQGVWRVVRTDVDETPVMRLSLVQDKGGAPEGDYMLLTGICGFAGGEDCALTGGTGEIAFGHHDTRSGRTTVTFAPTPDPLSRFVLRWTADGGGTLRPTSGTAAMPVRVIAVEDGG